MLSFPSKNADSKSNDIYFLHIHLIYSLSVSGLCCLLNLSPPSTDFECVESWMETSYLWGMGLRSDGARHLAWAIHLRHLCPLLSLAARLPGTGVSHLLPILLLVFWACRDLRNPRLCLQRAASRSSVTTLSVCEFQFFSASRLWFQKCWALPTWR